MARHHGGRACNRRHGPLFVRLLSVFHVVKRLIKEQDGSAMKILLFIHSLHYGGAERVAMNLSSEWVAQGLDVSVVTLTSTASDFYALHDSVDRITLDLAGGSGGLAGAVFAN